MPLLVSFLFVLFSILLPIVYIALFTRWADREIKEPSSTPKNKLKMEYEVLDRGVNQRENTLVLSGTIFVTSSLFLLGEGATRGSPRLALVLASWVIYAIWLFFFQLGSARYATVILARLRWIEENALGIEAHSFLYQQRIATRRWVWFILLNAILAMGNLLLGFGALILVNVIFVLVASTHDLVARRLRSKSSSHVPQIGKKRGVP